ncbi:MAG: ABC transporter permease [Thermoplasmatota archaeon]
MASATRGQRTWGFSHELQALGALWIRDFHIFQRERSRVISAIATPILWFFFLGFGFGQTISSAQLGGISYQKFIFPGVVSQAVLFGTVFNGLYIIWDRKLDVLKEVLAAPVSRTTIFFAKIAGGTTEAVLQSLIVLLIGIVVVGILPWGVPGALLVVMLLGAGFAGVGLTIGALLDSFEGFQVITTFLIFPIFFLSGALFQLKNLPWFLAYPSLVNPATYAVDALRGFLTGVHNFPFWLDFLALLIFDAVFVIIGTIAFRRMH